jgi:hypothetical protein
MIETRLREHVDAIAPPVELDEICLRSPLSAPSSHRALTMVALAALVAATVGVALQTSDDVTVTIPQTPVPGVWESVPDPDGALASSDVVDTFESDGGSTIAPSVVAVTDLVEHRDAVYAFGSVSEGARRDAAVWRWTDDAWEDVRSSAFEVEEERRRTHTGSTPFGRHPMASCSPSSAGSSKEAGPSS